MPWKETDVKTERIRFVVEGLRGEESVSALCQRYGISRRTGHKWLARSKKVDSLGELKEESRRPHHSPGRSSSEVEGQVVAARERYGWGSRKLQSVLAGEGVILGRSTIDRILDRHGVARAAVRARPAVKRFEREHPNELVQMDFKGQYPLAPRGWLPAELAR